jgi:CheY-like chemotaxis protein
VPFAPDKIVILLADDDPLVLNLVRNVLAREGYFVLVAADGQSALQLSRDFQNTIHLLLSDIEMPRMKGLELAWHIGQERPATKVLLMSGYMEDQIRVLNKPPDFLRKPFVPQELLASVQRILAEPYEGIQQL